MVEQAFRNIVDALRKEAERTSGSAEAPLVGKKYRWESWTAPKGRDGKLDYSVSITGDVLLLKNPNGGEVISRGDTESAEVLGKTKVLL